MENKSDKYKEALNRCEKLIANTRKHLEYNRKMLLCYEIKKRRIEKLMDQHQGTRLTGAVKENDIDIEALLEAIKRGELNEFKRKSNEGNAGTAETDSDTETASEETAEKAVKKKKDNNNTTNNENMEETEYGNSEHFEDTGSAG